MLDMLTCHRAVLENGQPLHRPMKNVAVAFGRSVAAYDTRVLAVALSYFHVGGRTPTVL